MYAHLHASEGAHSRNLRRNPVTNVDAKSGSEVGDAFFGVVIQSGTVVRSDCATDYN